MLGAQRNRIPAYAMVVWLDYDLDTLKRVCTTVMEQGFRGVKIKVGAPTLAEDIARIEAARAAMDPDALLRPS